MKHNYLFENTSRDLKTLKSNCIEKKKERREKPRSKKKTYVLRIQGGSCEFKAGVVTSDSRLIRLSEYFLVRDHHSCSIRWYF